MIGIFIKGMLLATGWLATIVATKMLGNGSAVDAVFAMYAGGIAFLVSAVVSRP